MAGRARLIPWLALGVLVAHGFALEWVGDHLEPVSILRRMPEPLFTRIVLPKAIEAPPAPARAATPPRRPRVAPAPRAAASKPAPVASAPEAVAAAPAASEPFVVGPDVPASAPPQQAVAAPAVAPASAASAAGPAEPLVAWPSDTRLSYRLGGQFRSGDLYGDARVQWQRDGASYQVRVDVDVTLWATLVMTSQGEVTSDGLQPRGYEELRRGKRRAVQLGERSIALEGGRSAARPAGVQDTASQFVELSHRFATGKETLEVGRTVSFWLARPGAVDLWTYDIVERVTLRTPNLGAIDAYHLKPRPLANPRGNIYAEMWFAPSLQYLPVRIKVSMGDEAHVDLLVDRIEQK